MKFGAALLVMATSALANNLRRGDYEDSGDYDNSGDYEVPENNYGHGDSGYKHEVTEVAVTYTTTTVCPVTYTHHEEGHTYYETKLTTSTLVVAETKTVDVTVKHPDVTKHYTDVEYVTRTTLCPVTRTKTIAGEVITEVYTTTSYIYDVVKTTDYEHVKQPDVTKHETDVVYKTRTTVCPVTVTKTIAGEVVTQTYTTTSVIEEVVKTTDYEHVKQPDVTKYETDVVYKTKTNVHPVTVTKTIAGEVITSVYTSTDYEVVKVHSTVYDQVKQPDVTKHETDIVYHTKYEVYPVTVTKTVEGEVVTNVYTSTSIVVEKVATTVPAYETIVKTMGKGVVVTQYSKIIHTVGGGTVYQTVAPEPTTVQLPETEVVTQPEVTVPPTPTAEPEPVVNGAAVAANKAPVFAFVAGILGAFALL